MNNGLPCMEMGLRIFFCTLGFSFSEVRLISASTSKIECCHFSSDGKLLATGGHDRKVSFGLDQIVVEDFINM